MNQIAIGKFIALKRKEKNLTQGQLAEILGISNKTISKWETGKCMPDYGIIQALCEALDITIAELMGGEARDKNTMPAYDESQILDMMARIQRLEKQKQLTAKSNADRHSSIPLPHKAHPCGPLTARLSQWVSQARITPLSACIQPESCFYSFKL